MHDWIPLLQTLVWPAFITVGLFLFRKDFRAFLVTTRERLGRGAAFKLGPGGIELGEIQAPPQIIALPAARQATEVPIAGADSRKVDDLPHSVYMTHWATRAPDLDKLDLQYYRLRIALDADSSDELRAVERVVYHLHPSFANPNRESLDRSSGFAIRTAGWGEFNMTAEVFRSGHDKPLLIERYINFLPPAV